MSKHVLVTGSAGFAAAHFVDHVIANTDWTITGLDSFRHRGDSLRVYQDPSRYKVYNHDLTSDLVKLDEEGKLLWAAKVVHKIGPVDYIVNMASESHVDRSITDPVPFCQNNVNLALNMLNYARTVKPEAFIQFGTDESYGPALEGTDHEEWSTILPSNPYAASKAAQEAFAISYWRTYGLPVILTNTMNLLGQRQDKEKYLPMLISKIQRGETVAVHGTHDYIGKRKYLHARNAADAILFILKGQTPEIYREATLFTAGCDRPDRYNVVGDVELDNLQLAHMVAEILRKPLKYELVDFHSARPGHDRRYSLSGAKLEKMGWKAPVEFHESLRNIVMWTLNHQEWVL